MTDYTTITFTLPVWLELLAGFALLVWAIDSIASLVLGGIQRKLDKIRETSHEIQEADDADT